MRWREHLHVLGHTSAHGIGIRQQNSHNRGVYLKVFSCGVNLTDCLYMTNKTMMTIVLHHRQIKLVQGQKPQSQCVYNLFSHYSLDGYRWNFKSENMVCNGTEILPTYINKLASVLKRLSRNAIPVFFITDTNKLFTLIHIRLSSYFRPQVPFAISRHTLWAFLVLKRIQC